MSSLSTLPKGDSAWLLRKAIERIIEQVSVLETNIGSSTTGNSANSQVIFNDNGTLRGDPDLTFNTALNKLVATALESTTSLAVGGSATITGDLTVDTSTLKVDSTNNRVIVGHTSGSAAFQVTNAGAAGLEIQPTGFSSAPLIQSYNRSGSAYTQLTLDGSTIVHALSGTTAMTLNSTGLVVTGKVTANTNIDIWRGLLNDGTSTGVGATALAATTAGATGNTALGYQAMYRATTGAFNTALGVSAGQGITTGTANVALGSSALGNNGFSSTGSGNVAIGDASMYSGTAITGANNVGVGKDTFRSLTSGGANVAIGIACGKNITSGNANVAIGSDALGSNQLTTGSTNVAIGNAAMYNSAAPVTGSSNVGIGDNTFRNLTSGASNIGIGPNALNNATTGNSNVAIGNVAGFRITTGAENVAIGINALNGAQAVTGVRNIAVGSQALFTDPNNPLTGSDNVALGQNAGRTLTTGGSNVFIGNGAAYSSNLITGSSNIGIGTDSLRTLSTGIDNVSLGRGSLNQLTSGSNNIALGVNSLYGTTNGSNNTAVQILANKLNTIRLNSVSHKFGIN